jgi:thiamine-phosphate pyrophosphorylase
MPNYGLYVVTDEGLSKGLSHLELAERAVRGGANVIQLRDKSLGGRRLIEIAINIKKVTKKAGALFIMNDRLDVAMASGADGVHLGQDDLPLKDALKLVPKGFIIGITVHDVAEAVEAQKGGASYLGLSPIFQTGSKSDAGAACGIQMIKDVKKKVSIPVVGIGGINAMNARDVLEAGADGIAVISAVVGQLDVEKAARGLKDLVDKYKLKRKI